jgi:hypothetical protein
MTYATTCFKDAQDCDAGSTVTIDEEFKKVSKKLIISYFRFLILSAGTHESKMSKT